MNLVDVNAMEQIVDKLAKINVNILRGRLERGGLLKTIKLKKLYIGYDSYVNSWAEFLDTINLNRETARQDMEVYDAFSHFLMHRIDLLESCSYERLVRLLPIVKKDPDSRDDLLEMTARTRRVDFDNNLKELKGGTATDSCENCMQEVIVLHKCKCCGLTVKADE
jgi:hypothetical protein